MKKIIALVLACVMVLALCACGSSSTTAASTSTSSAPAEPEVKKFVVGTSADYAPYEFMYPDADGNMVYGGIDISVSEFIAQELGMELQVENMAFDYLLTALQKGDYDIVIAALEDTPERRQAADFSDPYYTDLPAMILIRGEDADLYQTLNDFGGKTVGAQAATTKLEIAQNDLPGANVLSLVNVNDLVNELVHGKVDALVLDGAVAMAFVEANPDLAIAAASSELGEAAPYAIAVAKGDPKGLLPGINAAIAKLTEQNLVETFIELADSLEDIAEEVSVDAPQG